MVLSAPTVWEPLYTCTRTAVVAGFVPGATVDIFVTPPGSASPTRVGGGVSHSPTGRIFAVASGSMPVGGRVHAVQTLLGETSPPSRSVELQAPLAVDAPRLPGPLVACARCVFVDGLLPGADVEVRSGTTVLASGSAWAGGGPFGLSRPSTDADVVEAV